MSVLWQAMQDEAWITWSHELLLFLVQYPPAAIVLDAFKAATGTTVREWHSRTLGELATRSMRGAEGWTSTSDVDPALEVDWLNGLSITPAQVREKAKQGVHRNRRGLFLCVLDPAALGWLADTPVVVTNEDTRFAVWRGAFEYALLPATVATRLAQATGIPRDQTGSLLGAAAQELLTSYIESSSPVDERRIPESQMPTKTSKCDYLLETDDLLVGIEFTVARPPASIASGKTMGLDRLLALFESKIRQIYATFKRVDPHGRKRHLPLLVFASPNVVSPLLNERVHRLLVAAAVIAGR